MSLKFSFTDYIDYGIIEEVSVSAESLKEVTQMPVSKAQQKAVNKYMAANYDRVNLTLPKGRKAELQAYAQHQGESLNGFISRAIDGQMERDTSPQPTGTSVRGTNPLEGIPSFMAHAVDMEVRRDKAAWGLGFSPVAGEDVTKGGKKNE